MKTYPLFSVAILAVFVVSCTDRKSEDNSEALSDSSVAISSFEPTPEQIAQEQRRIQDSIRAAEEERIRQAQIEEDKNMKMKDANVWVNSFSKELMKIVSPWSGKNLYFEILVEESSYNPDTKTLTAVFQTQWDAIATYAGGDPETHVYKGKCIMYGTGQTRLEEIFQNEVLIRAIKATNAANELNTLLNRIDSNN